MGSQVEGQVDQKINHMASCWQVGRIAKKQKQKKQCFSRFCGPPAFQLRSKIVKKTSPDRSKIRQNLDQHLDRILMDFGTNLGRFWEGFGGQVGTKLGPHATKTRPQNQSKKVLLFGRPPDRFWMDFGSQVGPQQGKDIFDFPSIFGSWGLLGAKMGPRGPKEPQEAPKTASKTDFGFILMDF